MPYKNREKQLKYMRDYQQRKKALTEKEMDELVRKWTASCVERTHLRKRNSELEEEKRQYQKIVWQRNMEVAERSKQYDTAMRDNVQLRRIISEKDEQLVKACE